MNTLQTQSKNTNAPCSSEIAAILIRQSTAVFRELAILGRRIFTDYEDEHLMGWAQMAHGWNMHQCATATPMTAPVKSALDDGRLTEEHLTQWGKAFRLVEGLSVERRQFALAAGWYSLLVGPIKSRADALALDEPNALTMIADLQKTMRYIGRVEGALAQKRMHAKDGAAARVSKNVKPKRDAAIFAIRNELQDDPTASANEIAERLIGCPSIKLKHRTLAELASAEKKRISKSV